MILKKSFNNLKIIFAIHSTDDHFGFAYREIGMEEIREEFFIKKFEKDLSNNLIIDLGKFLYKKNFESIKRIAISTGPSNFNASRQIAACARTISHQLKCPLDHFSSFRIIAKRIAIKNKILDQKESFWIFKKLKNRGYIVGKYFINYNPDKVLINSVDELIKPKLFKRFEKQKFQYSVNYDMREDLKELIELSYSNHKKCINTPWDEALPIYPLSATN